MEREELIKNGVLGNRLRIAEFIKTKIYDIFVILLIIVYTLLIFVYFGLDGTDYEDTYNGTLYIIELVILAFFVIDISIHISAFQCLYLRDGWNIFDIVVICLSIIFVVLDMNVKNKTV